MPTDQEEGEGGAAAGAAMAWAKARVKELKVPGRNRINRQRILQEVFNQFDYDETGSVASPDIQLRGEALRSLEQGRGAWTESKTRKLMAKMDENRDGIVSSIEFVKLFDADLPKGVEAFDAVVESFLASAHLARQEYLSQLQLAEETAKHRKRALQDVFATFDYKGTGNVTKEELFALGAARRSKGQKVGVWTEEKSAKMLSKMDSDSDGVIDEAEFVAFFDRELPLDLAFFDETVREFQDLAGHVVEMERREEADASEYAAHRVAMLEKVFDEFDWNQVRVDLASYCPPRTVAIVPETLPPPP